MFYKIKTKRINYKTSELPSYVTDDCTLPALTAGINNQGLNNYVPRKNSTVLSKVISISANGANTGVTFYQPKDFTILQDAYAIDIKEELLYNLTDHQYLYITSCIRKTVYGNYEWTNKAGWEKVKNDCIQLPTKNGKIDFEFMESFVAELEAQRVAELEAQRVAELEAYLNITGLKDYELTENEKRALDMLDKVDWGEYDILEFVNTLPVKNKMNKDLCCGNKYPVYSSDTSNSGIVGYIDNAEFDFTQRGDYILFGDHTRSMNIPFSKFSVCDNVKVLKTKDKYSDIDINSLLFIFCVWKKTIPNLGYARHWKIAQNINFSLPTKKGKIDFEYMETLVSAIQKMVIKDVVLYADKKINATRKVIASKKQS